MATRGTKQARRKPISGNETRSSWPIQRSHFVKSGESELPEPRRMFFLRDSKPLPTRHFYFAENPIFLSWFDRELRSFNCLFSECLWGSRRTAGDY
jgi:hypothetical protein